MRLCIQGIGFVGKGLEEPFENGIGRLKEIPIKEYAASAVTRRFGRLAKLTYVAASRALADAGANPIEVAIVGATGLGETAVSIDLITQIEATKGKTISPKLIPNSVHNSPVGYLSIGYKNREPTLTVSEGKLSAEAGIAAAFDLIASKTAHKVLVVAGDEADPEWSSRLTSMGANQWGRSVKNEAFQECSAAVVLAENPGGRMLGSIAAGVERVSLDPSYIAKMLKRNGVFPERDVIVKVRIGTEGQMLKTLAQETLGRSPGGVEIEELGPGTLHGSGLASLVLSLAQKDKPKELLILGLEIDELSFLHFAS